MITGEQVNLQSVVDAAVANALRAAAPAPAVAPAVLPAAAYGAPPAFGAVVAGPWGQPAPAPIQPAASFASAAPAQPTGISLKCTLQLPDGSAVPFDLNFGPEAAHPAVLQATIAQMLQANVPVKVYPPRDNGFGGGGFGRGRGGFGGNSNGNGYGGGGFRRGGRW